MEEIGQRKQATFRARHHQEDCWERPQKLVFFLRLRDKPSRNLLTILLLFEEKGNIGLKDANFELYATGIPAKISQSNVGNMQLKSLVDG